MTFTAAFKYTFPITKSEQRADGRYIIGYASGPEVDLEGERMAPEAIQRFAEQINTQTDDPELMLVYRDAHAPDGVLRDLGVIKKAWINEHMHLGIEVRLDDDNPASDFLWKQVDGRKKQYGMSVSGRVLDYADEFVSEVGKTVRTYKNVVLDEISNTTRPAWYPSFGSVLSKSIKDAASAVSDGVHVLNEDELLDTSVEETAKAVEGEVASTEVETDKSSMDAYDASSAAYVAQSVISLMAGNPGDAELKSAFDLIASFMSRKVEMIDDEGTEKSEDTTEDEAAVDKSEDEATEDTTDEVDKAGRSISATNGKKLLGLYNEMTSTLVDLGLLEGAVESSDKSDSTDEEDALDKSTEETVDDGQAALQTQIEELAKANAEQAAKIEELMKAPRTPVPAAITDETKKSASELSDMLSKASPSERLRLAFALQTQGR